jgi:APA family basic amino acid/polyamine antiporter
MKKKGKGKLTLFDLVSMGVGLVIGSGIFSLLGTGIQFAGKSVALALTLGTFIVVFQQIRILIFSSVFPLEGGLYAQTALVMPKLLVGVSACMLLISNLGKSVIGIAIASYLVQLFPVLAPFKSVIAILVLTSAFLVTLKGSGIVSFVQNIMVVLMYVALLLLIVFGVTHLSPEAEAEPFFINGASGMFMAIAVMSFTCQGAVTLVNYTKDAENPKRTIPRALILTAVIVAIIYGLIGYASTSFLPYAEISGQNLGVVAKSIMPSGVYLFFMIGGAIFALATTILASVGAVRFPLLACAEDGWYPSVFTKKTKGDYPWVIMLIIYILTIVPVIGGFNFETIVSYIIVPSAVIGFICEILSLKIPKQYPAEWKKGSLHVSPRVYPIFVVIACSCDVFMCVFSLASLNGPTIIGNLSMTIGMFVYAFIRIKMGKVINKARESVTKNELLVEASDNQA